VVLNMRCMQQKNDYRYKFSIDKTCKLNGMFDKDLRSDVNPPTWSDKETSTRSK